MVCSLQHKWRVEDVRVNNLVAACRGREGGRQGGGGEEEGGGGGGEAGGEEEEKQRKQEGEKRERGVMTERRYKRKVPAAALPPSPHQPLVCLPGCPSSALQECGTPPPLPPPERDSECPHAHLHRGPPQQ